MSEGFAFLQLTKVERLEAEREILIAALKHIVAHYEEAGENLEVMEAEKGVDYAAGFYAALGMARDTADVALHTDRQNAGQKPIASELLAALKKWDRFARDNYADDDISFLAETRAAIAKAEGAI